MTVVLDRVTAQSTLIDDDEAKEGCHFDGLAGTRSSVAFATSCASVKKRITMGVKEAAHQHILSNDRSFHRQRQRYQVRNKVQAADFPYFHRTVPSIPPP